MVRNSEMTNFNGLAPFPNGVFYNWATIFILGFGNLSALDFQVRMRCDPRNCGVPSSICPVLPMIVLAVPCSRDGISAGRIYLNHVVMCLMFVMICTGSLHGLLDPQDCHLRLHRSWDPLLRRR